eukprot:m51a1_g14461 hypothetical protein (77) ;mRNA; r:659486-659716
MAQRVLQLLGDIATAVGDLQQQLDADAEGVDPAALAQVHSEALRMLAALRAASRRRRPPGRPRECPAAPQSLQHSW